MAELVLFAEFDIDKGSTVRGYYPEGSSVFSEASGEFFADVMLPEGGHNRESDYTVFFLKATAENPFLYCLSVVKTTFDSSAKRGATIRAVALCSQHQFYFSFKQILDLAIGKLSLNESNSQQILQELYGVINSVDISGVVKLNRLERMFLRRTICANSIGRQTTRQQKKELHFCTQIEWGDIVTPITIKKCSTQDQHDEGLLTVLLSTFGRQAMIIYNAVLTGCRIIMLGYGKPAGEVCNYVLSTSALVCPPLQGLIHRQFPYAHLTDLEFLTVPGYIAGVTNPMFKGKHDWWDLLCDISTGQVFSNHEVQNIDCETSDRLFADKVIDGIKAGLSEEWVRFMFEEYTQNNIVDIAFDEAVFKDVDTQVISIAANNRRITKWARTDSYKVIGAEREVELNTTLHSLRKHIRKLKSGNQHMSVSEIENIYADFVSFLTTEDDFKAFLAYLPDSADGLHVIAMGFFHSSLSIQYNTVVLFDRIESFPSTQSAVRNLNSYVLMTYNRVSKKLTPSSS